VRQAQRSHTFATDFIVFGLAFSPDGALFAVVIFVADDGQRTNRLTRRLTRKIPYCRAKPIFAWPGG